MATERIICYAFSMQENTAVNEYKSRRERRLLERSQRTSGGMPSSRRRPLIWGGAIVVLVLIVWGMVKLSANTPIANGDGTLAVAVNDTDNVQGPADAAVTLVEYSDFQCPACASFYSIVKQALQEEQLKGKIRFVYRSFPLTTIHPNANLAARAAQAAALQGKFWEMHDKLFEGQTAWAGLSDAGARDIFKGYASALGLNDDTFASDIDSGAVKDRVSEQSDGGDQSGVSSTPTFFLNGRQMPQPQNYEQFLKFLTDAAVPNP